MLGEIGNISMGTSATTLFLLLNQKVLITTPRVTVTKWGDLAKSYPRPCVGVRVNYVEGLNGTNILILNENDVKIIANLMMGGEGIVKEEDELTEIDLSAVNEAMNQMIGSSSTSLSSLINITVDIDTPKTIRLNFPEMAEQELKKEIGYNEDDILVCTSFRMEIGNLIDSEIMQVLPLDMALFIADKLMPDASAPPTPPPEQPQPQPQQMQAPPPQPAPQQNYGQVTPQMMPQQTYAPQQNINVQPVDFQNFDVHAVMQQKENIDIIKEVPLEVTVELGRTRMKIKEILEFAPGTIFVLDRLAGEPIDVLVNGKLVARGEVVVVDENFSIKVTEIMSIEANVLNNK
jgi:flagellar motor switch protein FliN/FliY